MCFVVINCVLGVSSFCDISISPSSDWLLKASALRCAANHIAAGRVLPRPRVQAFVIRQNYYNGVRHNSRTLHISNY